jgi:hypothetical protein
MFNDMMKYDNKSSLSKNFFEFYRNYENHMLKLRNILNKLNNDIIEPVNLFSKHLTGKYTESLAEFKNVIGSTYEYKKVLEKSKYKYFDSCKLAVEQEKLVLKVMSDREKNLATDDEISHAHDILFKLRSQAENKLLAEKEEQLN